MDKLEEKLFENNIVKDNINDNYEIQLKKKSKDNIVDWANSIRDDEIALLSNM